MPEHLQRPAKRAVSKKDLRLLKPLWRQALQPFGDQPIIMAYESHLSLARISYQWNDLHSAQRHGEKSVQLARQYDESIDRYVICEVFLARLKLARGDIAGAAALLAEVSESVRRHNFVHRMPEVVRFMLVAFFLSAQIKLYGPSEWVAGLLGN